MISIEEFANQILFAQSLEAKLLRPSDVKVTNHNPLKSVPTRPGRPPELDLTWKTPRIKTPFPTEDSLILPRSRALVFHFFANHELLALELMALALLRFPDSPVNFRQGIVRTMFEEQEHLKMYLNYMKKHSVEFGEIPVNDFFWTHIAGMNNALEYVANMSLTLEQANLDFAQHYARLFQNANDSEGFSILQQILIDEIGHVKHGIVWFERWRDKDESFWQSYIKHLRYPITPQRAKGIGFTKKHRIEAGFQEDFIAEIATFSSSKGRPPVIYVFNMTCELSLAQKSFMPSKRMQQLRSDYAHILMYCAHQDDIVLVEKQPSKEFLLPLLDCGFELPEFTEWHYGLVPPRLNQQKFASICLWGFVDSELNTFKELLSYQTHTPEYPTCDVKKINSKVYSTELNQTLLQSQAKQIIVKTEEETAQGIKQIGFPLVIKYAFGASAQKHLVLKDEHSMSSDHQRWIQKHLTEPLIVEEWHNRVLDLSVQLQISKDATTFLGVTRCLNDSHGHYLGSIIGRISDAFSPLLRKLYYSQFFPELKQHALKIGDKLRADGYVGPVGIDAYIYQGQERGELKLRSLVEINARHTMGRIALEFASRITPAHTACWLHLTRYDLKKMGLKEFYDIELPSIEKLEGSHPKIKTGGLFTSDPSLCQHVCTILLVAKDHQDLVKIGQAMNLTHHASDLFSSRESSSVS